MVQEYYHKREFFDEKAPRWKISETDRRSLDWILAMLDLPEKGIFLDVGCGTGGLFQAVMKRRPDLQVIGVDLSLKMLEQCRLHHPQPVLAGLGESLPFAGETAAVVMNYCCYPHIVDKRAAVREYYRVLQPGGRFYILHPKGRREIDEIHDRIGGPVCHDKLCPVSRVFKLLSAEGFTPLIGMDREEIYLVEAVKN